MKIPSECQSLAKHQLHKSTITKLHYSPLGTKLAAVSLDTTISVIKSPTQKEVEVTSLQGHNSTINSVNFSASDNLLLSSSNDKSCIIWNMTPGHRGQILMVLDHVYRPRIS